MNTPRTLVPLGILLAALFATTARATAAPPDAAFTPAATLQAFASEQALKSYLQPLVDEHARRLARQRAADEERQRLALETRRRWEAEHPGQPYPPPPPLMPAPAAAPAAAAKAESITNAQSAGVDEGGIVKVHGKHLVVLRRGRLFTLDVDHQRMAPVATVNAFGSDVSPHGAWYDEMLVAGNTVVVIGYSYARGGTEIGLFNISDEGQLSYRATWHLRSSDYYSSRNYASRLVGSKLVFYAPVWLGAHADPLSRLPGLRRWHADAAKQPFERIADATRIYHTGDPLDAQRGTTLHTVVSCDLAQPQLTCQSTGLLGPAGRVFYVSPRAVYVWTAQWPQPDQQPVPAAVYRLPLDGGAPSALQAQGSPLDQFSFLEGDDGYLNVLVRAQGKGDGMWRGESPAGGNLSLLRVPVREFGDGQARAADGHYHPLPAVQANTSCGSLQNRFVADHLLYGAGCSWWRKDAPSTADLHLLRYAKPWQPATTLSLAHGVDRIEAMGRDAVVVGSHDRDLLFSAVQLSGTLRPRIASTYTLPDASQGETRSHGFFYKPDGGNSGVIGLPVRGAGQPGYRQLWDQPAAMLYLRNDQLRFKPIGQLPARPGIGRDDNCQASCADWYGNARPIFLRNRVFALMGYELVEGRILKTADGERLVETRRVAFQPGAQDYAP